MNASLHVLLQVPNYVPEEKKFDLLVLVRNIYHVYQFVTATEITCR